MSGTPYYFQVIAEFIARHYPNAKKIVEIGVGRTPFTALVLKKLIKNLDMIIVDKDQVVMDEIRGFGLRAFVDDIWSPRLELYRDADLIYSIRPPFELFSKIVEIGESVGSDVLIIPLAEDAYLADTDKRLERVELCPGINCLYRRISRK
ncbi:MAG: UPF0146 family protein [Nitrososphaerota archaeon]